MAIDAAIANSGSGVSGPAVLGEADRGRTVSERILRLRRHLLKDTPVVSIERARYYTEHWRSTQSRTVREESFICGGGLSMYRPVYSERHSVLYFSSDPASSDRVFSGGSNVFVCGALQNPARMSALLGLEAPFAPAVATGYQRSVERIDGREIPFMIPGEHDSRSVLTGVVWLDLSKASLDRIESLELDGGYRRRIAIEVRIGELDLTAYTYVRK